MVTAVVMFLESLLNESMTVLVATVVVMVAGVSNVVVAMVK
jgi:hypothetical protein